MNKTMKLFTAAGAAALASLSLASAANAATVTTSAESLDFGNVEVGQTATRTVQLNVPCLYVLDLGQYGGKSCTAPGRVDSIATSDAYTQVNDCPTPINNNKTDGTVITCTVTVSFTPRYEGAVPGALNFAAYNTPDAYSVALTGTGVAKPTTPTGETPGNSGGKGGSKVDPAGGGSAGTVAAAKKCSKKKAKGARKSKKCKKARR